MKNYIQEGTTLTLVAPYALTSGDPFLVGSILAVAQDDALISASVVGVTEGVFALSVKGVNDDGNSAVAIGDKLYFDDNNTPKITKKSAGRYFGKALATVGSGSTATINVDLCDCGGSGGGTADIPAESVTLAKMADLARGYLISGQTASNRPTALNAKTSGYILVGDGTDLASVAVSGDVTLATTGAVSIGADKVTNTILANMTRGTVKVGGTADAPTDLDAKSSGQILVGDGTDIKSVAVSGDVTLSSAGAVAIGAGKVTSAMLANGAGIAAAVAAGLGASAAYIKTNDGPYTLKASTGADRAVLLMIAVDETFADVGGTQTTFIIGETGTTNKFLLVGDLVGATAGTVIFRAGILTSGANLLVTAGARTVTGTGGISVTALLLPTA